MFYALLGLLQLVQPLGFYEALDLASRSPVMQAAERVPTERKAEADGMSRLTANPTLQVQPGGRRMSAGGQGAELYLGINQRLSLGGFGKQRKVAVAREAEHDMAVAKVTRQELRLTVARAWLSRWTAQQTMELSKQEQGLALELEQRIAQTVSAGEGTRVDLSVARAWRAEAALTALAAEGDAFVAGVELSRALGVTADAPVSVVTEPPQIELPAGATARIDGEHTPGVEAARAERAMEQARLEEVKAARAPQLSVGMLGWREGAGDLAAVATLEVEIPIFERGQRERATQAAAIARADGAAIEATLRARSERALVAHEVEHSAQVLETTETELVTAAESLAEAQRLRLEAQEGTAQEWVQARRWVLKAKLDAVRARADHLLSRFVAQELWQYAQREAAGRRP